MKGLELSKSYFETHGLPMLKEQFPQLLPRMACGLCGAGSDCLGYDDEVSLDHDIKAGFMIWLSDEDFEEYGFALSAAYDRLPREHMGFPSEHRSRMGDGRYGVKRRSDFFCSRTGSPTGPASAMDWLRIPSHYLAECSCGEVFGDGDGEFSAIRKNIAEGMPEDVRLKKMAARCALAAQSGQYNYSRCLSHGEAAAAEMAVFEFCSHYMALVFFLNKKHMPFYKWAFRAMRELPVLGSASDTLQKLLTEKSAPMERSEIIENLAAAAITEIKAQGLSASNSDFLLHHGEAMMGLIKDPEIAALHLMDA